MLSLIHSYKLQPLCKALMYEFTEHACYTVNKVQNSSTDWSTHAYHWHTQVLFCYQLRQYIWFLCTNETRAHTHTHTHTQLNIKYAPLYMRHIKSSATSSKAEAMTSEDREEWSLTLFGVLKYSWETDVYISHCTLKERRGTVRGRCVLWVGGQRIAFIVEMTRKAWQAPE